VREHFLLPEIVRRYLVLLRHYTGVDGKIPPFRMNGLSYHEVLGMLKTGSMREESLPAAKWAV
jgi:trehalose synthase